MNEFDSERIEYIMGKMNYLKVQTPDEADLIIFNTCSVRKKAENRLYGNLGNLKELKTEKPKTLICVGGCTAQSMGKKLIQDFPFIDIVFGTDNIGGLTELIERRKSDERYVCSVSEYPEGYPDYFEDVYSFNRNFRFKSYLPISVGCNNFCSYCIVPHVRGRERSIEPSKIIKTIKKLVNGGVVEIILLGQNVNSYGNDFKINGKKYGFCNLLEDIVGIERLKRIRFMTSHPKDFTRDIVKVIKNNKNMVKHIHLPLQAGSDRILNLMNRQYTVKEYIDIYEYIKSEIPDCAITTDIIVGFPGELLNDFKKTLRIIKRLKFNRAFTFIYSPRRGTEAENFIDNVDYSEKKKWFLELIELQNMISLEENKKLVGKKFEVLVEGITGKEIDQYAGRLEYNIIANFKSPRDLTGKFTFLNILTAKPFYLIGELENNAS